MWKNDIAHNKKAIRELFEFMYWSLLEEKARIQREVKARFISFNERVDSMLQSKVQLSIVQPQQKAIIPV